MNQFIVWFFNSPFLEQLLLQLRLFLFCVFLPISWTFLTCLFKSQLWEKLLSQIPQSYYFSFSWAESTCFIYSHSCVNINYKSNTKLLFEGSPCFDLPLKMVSWFFACIYCFLTYPRSVLWPTVHILFSDLIYFCRMCFLTYPNILNLCRLCFLTYPKILTLYRLCFLTYPRILNICRLCVLTYSIKHSKRKTVAYDVFWCTLASL